MWANWSQTMILKEPFIGLGGMSLLLASTGAFADPAMADRVGAVLAGGVCSCLYSLWKSRKRRADRTDSAIWALIALFGSMSLGWFVGPVLAGQHVLGFHLPGVAVMTWLLAIGGSPAIEWLLDGRGFRLVLDGFKDWFEGWRSHRGQD